MRSIKFRAWDKTNKVMLNIEFLDFSKKRIGSRQFVRPSYPHDDYQPKLPQTIKSIPRQVKGNLRMFTSIELLQFTGLKDSKDREIFEGDILEGWSKLDLVEVVYISAGFWFVNKGKALQRDIEPTINAINNHLYQVIGNIYENPELLN